MAPPEKVSSDPKNHKLDVDFGTPISTHLPSHNAEIEAAFHPMVDQHAPSKTCPILADIDPDHTVDIPVKLYIPSYPRLYAHELIIRNIVY